jgi:hypothetical protein
VVEVVLSSQEEPGEEREAATGRPSDPSGWERGRRFAEAEFHLAVVIAASWAVRAAA